MIEALHLIQSIVEQGLIFSLVVAAVYIASRLINFDNLSVEGSFGIGGALSAMLIVKGINPWLALLCAALAGIAAGMVTAALNAKLKLNNLISGMVVTTGIYSLALKTAGTHMTVSSKATIFNTLSPWLDPLQSLVILMVACALVFTVINWLLTTEIGFLLRAVGDTPQMLTNVGKSVDGYRAFGLALSNMLGALCGALFVQYVGYFSISVSLGILIIGLAGMILAETFNPSFGIWLIAGSIAYQAIIAMTFELQLNQDWNKLITAVLIVLLIVIKQSFHKKQGGRC